MASGVDAILIDAVSPTTIKSAVEKAKAKGILVVIANDPAAYEDTICVCGDNYTWQKIQAMWLMDQIEGKGDIVKITGVSGNAADTIREQANDDVLAEYPDVNVLTSAPGNWSQTDAQSVLSVIHFYECRRNLCGDRCYCNDSCGRNRYLTWLYRIPCECSYRYSV